MLIAELAPLGEVLIRNVSKVRQALCALRVVLKVFGPASRDLEGLPRAILLPN